MSGLTERERELRTQIKSLWDDKMAPLVEKSGKGERLSVEERKAYDDADKELTDLRGDLKVVISGREHASAERDHRDEPDTRGARGDEKQDREQREIAAFSKYFVGGDTALTSEDRALLTPHAQGIRLRGGDEQRIAGPDGDSAPMQSPVTYAVSGGASGGYLVPAAFWHNLQIAMKAYGGVYPHFRQVDTDTGAPMNWPTNDPTTLVATLMSTENTVLTPQDITFGFGQLLAYTYVAGPFLASIQLLNDSAFSVDTFVRDRISEAIGRAQAAVSWAGTGSAQPLGLSAALTAKGISGSAGTPTPGTGGIFVAGTTNGYKVNTFGTNGTAILEQAAGAMSYQTVFQLISIVDAAYRGVANAGPSVTTGNPAWYMNDSTLQVQRTVVDNFGRPLIQQSVNMGGTAMGETLGGYPVVIDNNAPSIAGNATPSASNASGPVFGSLNHAMVARNVRDVGVMRLNERFADFLSVAWLGYMRYDIRSNDMRAVAQKSYGNA